MATSKDQPILIVGAGTFGLSTAWELSKNGYENITVFDRASAIPSPFSAGCDLNKILRAEYEDPFYTELALEAFAAWKSPFFAPYYRQVGLVVANSAAAEQKERDSLSQSLLSIEKNPKFQASIQHIASRDDMKRVAPNLTGSMNGWAGYFNKLAGYARAGKAMRAVYDACKSNGVRFILGDHDGYVKSLIYDGRRCIGVRTASDKEYMAARTIICLGAHVARLLPSIAPQITAKAWAVAHIQLSKQQARSMAGIPVINCRDLGFFFEPDADTGLVKLCAHDAGLTNYQTIADGKRASIPVTSKDHAGAIPRESDDKIRKLIAATMPQFSSLPLIRKFICWCGDTTDSNFIIDFVPGTEAQSLMVFSGDSGHAFKMLPIAGQWAVKVLEEGKQKLDRWKWKTAPEGSAEDIHWRPGTLRDIKAVKDWVPEAAGFDGGKPKALL